MDHIFTFFDFNIQHSIGSYASLWIEFITAFGNPAEQLYDIAEQLRKEFGVISQQHQTLTVESTAVAKEHDSLESSYYAISWLYKSAEINSVNDAKEAVQSLAKPRMHAHT